MDHMEDLELMIVKPLLCRIVLLYDVAKGMPSVISAENLFDIKVLILRE